MAKAKSSSTSVAAWDAELAAMAELQATTESAVGASQWMSIRAGMMTYQGADVPGNKMRAVIPISVFENSWYEGEFDPAKPATPACFALSEDGIDMAPHPDSPSPQNKVCGTQGQPGCCPKNEFGSADRGRGKACKNIRRIALIPENEVASADDATAAAPAFLKIPVTSVKGWASYVQNLAGSLKKPTFAVVTEVSCRPDPQKQVVVGFRMVEELKDRGVMLALKERIGKLKEALLLPYQKFNGDDEPAPASPSKGRRGSPAKGKKY